MWSLVMAIIVCLLAIAEGEKLSNIVSNFVSILGYWVACFILILLIDDQVFRRSQDMM
jgi:purine-cytosine permease-like protein